MRIGYTSLPVVGLTAFFTGGVLALQIWKNRGAEIPISSYLAADALLDAKNHAWAAENILYIVPNDAAMEALPAELLEREGVPPDPSRLPGHPALRALASISGSSTAVSSSGL